MKDVVCEECGTKEPMSSMYEVLGRSLCEQCANAELARHAGEDLPPGSVVRLVDPTVCRNCQADSGGADLPLVAGMPVCESCEWYFRHRPFPAWIKLAFAVLVVVVAFSFAYNWRF